MNKQIITFSADEQKLVKTGGINCYASNIVSYIEAHFALGQNWNGYDSVRAVWSNDNNMTVISTVLDSNGHCIVPFEVLKTMGVVKVNLVGSISASGVLTDRLTTFPCEALAVARKAKINGSETAPITPSQFEQFVSIVQDAVANIKDIVSTTLNADYTLTFVYSDGTSYTTPSIRGERGPQGADGADGADGNGIASAVLNSNYTLTLTFTDGTSYTTPSIRGAQGPKGDPGDVSQAQLDAAVSDLKSEINEDEELLGKTVSYDTEELYDSSSIITGGYASGNVGSAVSIASANNNIYQIVNVSDGEEYILSGRAFNDAFHYVAVFVDENDIILEKDRPTVESASTYTDYHVIVPTNAVKMYFNSVVSVPNSIKKVLSTSTAFGVPYSALSSEVQAGLSRSLADSNKVLIFGDSWTAANSPASTKKWCDYVQEELMFDMSNFAASGTGYKAGKSYIGKRINDKTVAGFSGFIVVFGSGNDCQYMDSDAGTVNDLYNPSDGTEDTVCGRVNYAFNVIKTKAPLAKVLIISPCAWQIYPPTSPSNAMVEYCNLLKQCTENAGFMYADMYNNSGLRPWDDTQADYWYEQSPANRVHPNNAGQYFLYPQMREIIKKILPNIVASN